VQTFISESAFADLEGIKEYYSEQGVVEIGFAFVSSILEQIETLKEYPDIGRMVPEFDAVVFNEELHVVHGPVKTDFGYHLLEITSRED